MRFGMRELIFILALLAMPVAAYIFVFEPRNAQIADARREILVKEEKLAQLESATRSMSDLGQEIDKLSEAITVFEEKLPAQREVEEIVKQVWELAVKHGLNPKSIRTDKPIISPGYAEQPIPIIITGDFDGFYSFLLDLEKLQRITRMPDMKIEKLRDSEGQMQASIVLSVFFESPQDPNAGTSGGPRL